MKGAPQRKALEWVRRQVSWAREIRTVRSLPGATSSSLFEFEASGGRDSIRLVLRLIDNPEWLAESPDIARHEAAALRWAGSSSVPVPELIAFDEWGSAAGVPAVLMSKLDGRVELGHQDIDRWLIELAETPNGRKPLLSSPLEHQPSGRHSFTATIIRQTYYGRRGRSVGSSTGQTLVWARPVQISRTVG
jgi:hypothetical protein